MKEARLYDEVRTTPIRSALFDDGMIVTADDLTTAVGYPIELLQTLIRAYFGCGVVCGLNVEEVSKDGTDTFCAKVERGVALDCHGYPMELCQSVIVDLAPDPCEDLTKPYQVYVAIRRDTCSEGPRLNGDDCGDGTGRTRYRRQRELVRIKVFHETDRPKHLCGPVPASDRKETCACLQSCPEPCCGEGWVQLARVEVGKDSITVDGKQRRYVRPIECHCPPEDSSSGKSGGTATSGKGRKSAST